MADLPKFAGFRGGAAAICALAVAVGLARAQDPVAVATIQNFRVELHKAPGPCQGQALSAASITDGTKRINGCWVPQGPDKIAVAWLDGDYYVLPISAFREPLKN